LQGVTRLFRGIMFMQTAEKPYRLAPHVHACRTGRDIVMLDLKRDRYFGVDPADASELAPLVSHFPTPVQNESSNIVQTPPPSSLLLKELLEAGSILPGVQTPDEARRAELERPEAALIEGYTNVRVHITIVDITRMLAAVAIAGALMKWGSLHRISKYIASSRRQAHRHTFDIDKARERIAAFHRLRPFLYTSAEACLFSSLAIQSFLARDKIFPRFVFGVATRPFKAHCWLQRDGVVLNDMPEHVREYTPILVI
jgi:hypothetical protein